MTNQPGGGFRPRGGIRPGYPAKAAATMLAPRTPGGGRWGRAPCIGAVEAILHRPDDVRADVLALGEAARVVAFEE
ncbi:hypothetical protein ACWCP6_36590 [Streptomyces sp. NPDC002004]